MFILNRRILELEERFYRQAIRSQKLFLEDKMVIYREGISSRRTKPLRKEKLLGLAKRMLIKNAIIGDTPAFKVKPTRYISQLPPTESPTLGTFIQPTRLNFRKLANRMDNLFYKPFFLDYATTARLDELIAKHVQILRKLRIVNEIIHVQNVILTYTMPIHTGLKNFLSKLM
jgi:hypothetical protein